MVDIQTNPLYYAALGGIILGISTSLHYVLKGNVTGLSRVIYDVAFFNMNQFSNKLIIIGGIIIASGIFFDIFGYQTINNFTPFGPKQNISEYTSFIGYAVAGLLVGFGAKLGNGCTSGHGLCGLPRLSIRSFVAVGVSLPSAIAIATIKYYFSLGPFSQIQYSPKIDYAHLISSNLCIVLGLSFLIIGFTIQKVHTRQNQSSSVIIRDNIISLFVGLIFGTGLVVAGMVRRRNILQFLYMGKDWNPSLLFVLGCGVIFNLVVFNYMIRVKKTPLFGDKLFNPEYNVIDWQLVLGSFSFGIGWGIGGLCPGPAIALLPVFQVQIHVIWFATCILGMYLGTKLTQATAKKSNSQPKATIEIKPIQNTNSIIKISSNNSISKSKENKKGKQNKLKESNKNLGQEKVQNYNLDNINMDSIQELQSIPISSPTKILQNDQQIMVVGDDGE